MDWLRRTATFAAWGPMGLLVILMSEPALAQGGSRVGLGSGVKPRALGEAVTAADGLGADALLYNPALLPRGGWHLGVAGVAATADRASTRLAEASQKGGNDDDPLGTVVGKLGSDKPTFAGTDVRLLDVVTPYGGFMGFGDVSVFSQHDAEAGRHRAQVDADAGAAVGLAAKLGPLSAGYSHYWLNRAGFGVDVDGATRDQIVAATATGPLEPGQFSYGDFSSATFGGTTGHNVGLVLRPIEGNISQLGVAVLNAGGGSKFSKESAYGNPSTAGKMSGALHEEAARYGIPVGLPEDLPEMINAGLQLGVGTESDGGKSTTWRLALLADYADIDGDTIDDKFAAGATAGLTLSDKLALATGVPVLPLAEDYKEFYMHVGIKAIEAYAGYRPGAYATGGARLQLHVGVSNRIAPAYIEIDMYSLTADPDGDYISVMGVSVALAGALMF
jgi:hypothetical protein